MDDARIGIDEKHGEVQPVQRIGKSRRSDRRRISSSTMSEGLCRPQE